MECGLKIISIPVITKPWQVEDFMTAIENTIATAFNSTQSYISLAFIVESANLRFADHTNESTDE